MIDISNITAKATRAIGRSQLLLKKHSPAILVGAGLICTVGAVVIASHASLKVEDILDEHVDKVATIERVHNGKDGIDPSEYSDDDYKKDLRTVKIQTGINLVKNYIPAATLEVVGIACILCGFGILQKRSVAYLAMYKASEQAFSKYRARVAEEYGEDKEKDIYNGIERKVETVKNEKDKKVKQEVTSVVPGGSLSPYARFFDEANPNWSKDAGQNMFFLTAVQNQMNDLLKSRGHVFLNEVYDALGFERTTAGQLVGWVYNQNVGDDYIDFDIFRFDQAEKRDFVNAEERSVLLDFNVAGEVYDLI